MAIINWPDTPLPGDRFTKDQVTYQWMSDGFWKSIEASVGQWYPNEFAFYLNSVPATTTEILYRLDIASGQTLDLEAEYAFALIGNLPVNDQVYNIYLNEVLATDTLTVDTSGAILFNLPRFPLIGPVTIKVRVDEDTIVDPLFDGFGLMSEVYTI
jgi:hypothetical protein